MYQPSYATEDPAYQRELISRLLKLALFCAPLVLLVYLISFIRDPSSLAPSSLAGPPVMWVIAWWCQRRVRAGDMRTPARILLAMILLTSLRYLVKDNDAGLMFGALGLGLSVALASALEPPERVLRWGAIATVAGMGGVIFRENVHPTPLQLGPVGNALIYSMALSSLLAFALLGRAATRHLHEAFAKSEAARQALARSHDNLARQRAELESYTSVVSHDLRAPLRALLNYSRFLEEDAAGKLDDTCQEHVHNITESARHMDALVTALLEYSRIGQERVTPEPVDVGALLEHIVAHRRLRDRADVTLPADAPTLRALPVRLEQVFSNLIENGVKFRRPGIRPAVAVEWADRGSAWEFTVRDNGIGIDPKHFDRIFGMFQRLHARTEYEGTGIGLAIVKKAVEEHGGQISVESTPGQGTVFRFTVPREGERVPQTTQPHLSTQRSAGSLSG